MKAIFLRQLPDVILRKQAFPISGIYNGIIKKVNGAESFVYVDAESGVGKLPRNEVGKNSSSTIVVQVQRKHTTAGSARATLQRYFCFKKPIVKRVKNIREVTLLKFLGINI